MKPLALLTCLVMIGLIAVRLHVSPPNVPVPAVRFPPANLADLAAQHEIVDCIQAVRAVAEAVGEETRTRPDASFVERESLSFDPGEIWRVESYGAPLFSWQVVEARAAQKQYVEAVLRQAGQQGVFTRMNRAIHMQSWPCSDPPSGVVRGDGPFACEPTALWMDLGKLWFASRLASARLCQAAGDGESAAAAEALRIQLALTAVGRALPASSGGYLESFPLDEDRQQVIQWLASMRHPVREVWIALAGVYDVDAPVELRDAIGAERATIAVELFQGDMSRLPVELYELFPKYLPESFFDPITGRSSFQIVNLDCKSDALGRAYVVTLGGGYE